MTLLTDAELESRLSGMDGHANPIDMQEVRNHIAALTSQLTNRNQAAHEALEKLGRANAEVARLSNVINLHCQEYVTDCVYCGLQQPFSLDTYEQVCREHDKVCPKNPQRELETQLTAATASQLRIARAYDPNCDAFDEADQIAAMTAARQAIEAVQELAKQLGRDPEGCLVDAIEEAGAAIAERDELKESLTAATAELAAIKAPVEGDGQLAKKLRAAWLNLGHAIGDPKGTKPWEALDDADRADWLVLAPIVRASADAERDERIAGLQAKLEAAEQKLAIAQEAGLSIGLLKEAGKEPRLTWDIIKDSPLAKEADGVGELTVRNAELEQERDQLRQRVEASSPDDLRDKGWAVAVHNDYRQGGENFTFWLFTKGGHAIKGEGRSDAEALDMVREAIAALLGQAEAANDRLAAELAEAKTKLAELERDCEQMACYEQERHELAAALGDLAERAERARKILTSREGGKPTNWAMLDTTEARKLLGDSPTTPAPSASEGEGTDEPIIISEPGAAIEVKVVRMPDHLKRAIADGLRRGPEAATSPPDPEFKCPKCGCSELDSTGDRETEIKEPIVCGRSRCRWSGTWAEVAAIASKPN